MRSRVRCGHFYMTTLTCAAGSAYIIVLDSGTRAVPINQVHCSTCTGEQQPICVHHPRVKLSDMSDVFGERKGSLWLCPRCVHGSQLVDHRGTLSACIPKRSRSVVLSPTKPATK